MSQASLLSPSVKGGEITRESFPDYVQAEITRTTGPQLACYRAAEILTGFWDRLGALPAMAVCELAFGPHGGMWRGAPVTVLRFQEGHDEFFARPLLAEASTAQP